MLYFKNLLQKYKFKYIFLKAILISTFIFLLINSNIVSLFKRALLGHAIIKGFEFHNLVSNIDGVLFICMITFLSIFIIYKGIENQVWRDIKSEKICYSDKLALTLFSTELLFLLSLSILTFTDTILTHLILILVMITVVWFEFRIFIFNQLLKDTKDKDVIKKKINSEYRNIKDKKSSLITLQDLLDGNLSGNELILLEERAIESENEDLFDNKSFISGFEGILLNCSPIESYVFALLGKWGSGKTSIINLLKEKINISKKAKIQTFSPWKYNDKYSLFAGFYNFIADTSGINDKYIKNKNIYRKYQKIIFGVMEKKYNIPFNEIFNKSNEDIIEEIKQDINNCISSSDKKIIVVIDDMDRLNKEQILFIFNIVNNIFNFNNLVYVLCFDEEIITQLLSEELPYDPHYIDKIVQLKIKVPSIDNRSIRQKGIKCLKNILQHYQVKPNEKQRLDNTLNIIFSNFTNLRQLTRFLNSVSSSIHCFKDINLDISDLIALEYVKHVDISLYSYLANNPRYLVSEDENYLYRYSNEYEKYNFYNNYASELTTDNNLDELSKEAKSKFDSLFENKMDMVTLLANVFPNLQTYYEGRRYGRNIFAREKDRRNSVLLARCHNGRFFNIYFNNTSNSYIELNKSIEMFINNINKNQLYNEELNDLINNKNHDDNTIQLLLELINWRVNDIKNLNRFVDYLLSTYMTFENKFNIVEGVLQRSIYTILGTCINLAKNEEHGNDVINKILKKDLRVLDGVLRSNTEYKYEDFYVYGRKLIIDKLNKFIKNRYNLFNKSNYRMGLLELFYIYVFKHDKLEQNLNAKEYMKSLINKETVFRFIGDCLTESIVQGDMISFECINDDAIKTFVDLSVIYDALQEVDYILNKDQQKVKQAYENRNKQNGIIDGPIKFSNL